MVYIMYAFFSLSMAFVSAFLKRNAVFVCFCVLVLVYCIFLAFSYKAGSDWFNYLADYNAGCGNPNFEIGFRNLCSVFHSIGADYWLFAFFIKVFYVGVVAFFIWKIGSPPLESLAIYILISSVFLENLLRQQLSAAIVLIALCHLRRGFLVGLILVLVACMFHASAIFCLPLWIMYKSKLMRTVVLYLSGLFFFLHLLSLFAVGNILNILASSFPNSTLIGKVSFYLTFERYPVTFGHFLRFGLLVVFAYLFKRAQNRKIDYGVFEGLCIIYSGFLLMVFYEMVFYDFGVFWMRVREFFVVFFVMFPLYLTRYYYPRVKIITFIFLIIYASYVFYGFFSLPVFDELYAEYKNYIIESLSQDVGFNALRDSSVEKYWKNWKHGEIR